MTTANKQIHIGMLNVAIAMEKSGIAKESQTQAAGRYKYRGIDAVLNALAKPLVDACITVSPAYTLVSCDQIDTKEGKGYMTTVAGTITFTATDGSQVVSGPFIGQAFDSLDKGATKAMSVAFRTGMFLTFCIPLGPGHDTEENDEAGDTITEDQADELYVQMTAAGVDQKKFYDYLKITALTQLPASKLKVAQAGIAAKAKANQGAA